MRTGLITETTAPSRRIERKKPNNKKEAKRRRHQRQEGWKNAHFLSRLPPEVRNLIYQYVLAPSPEIKLAKSQFKGHYAVARSDRQKRILRCDHPLGKYSRWAGMQTKWKTSISGILLANKQTYRESLAYMYESCTFEFGPAQLAQDFLRVVRKPNLVRIKHVKLWHEFPSPGNEMGKPPQVQRHKSDETFLQLCALLAARLPGTETLEVQIDGCLPLLSVVPNFATNPNAATVESLRRVNWLCPLKQFKKLPKLRSITVQLPHLNRDDLVRNFYNTHRNWTLSAIGQLSDAQVLQIANTYVSWCETLYQSNAKAAEDLILMKDEEGVWKEHIKLLEGFQSWRLDPLASYETYLPLPEEDESVEVEKGA